MMSAPKLRLLCLHGFRQSATKFSGRTAALRKALKSSCDCYYADGPWLLPDDAESAFEWDGGASGLGQRAWWDAHTDEESGAAPHEA